MNCDTRNKLLSQKDTLDRDDLWPKVKDYESRRYTFRWDFGLEELPEEPGILVIRGARQIGKSTWLELMLLSTIEGFGPGTGFILNGDEISDEKEFEEKILILERSFKRNAKVKRIFIDEITEIKNWETVLKRLIDQGHLKDILVITTGSNAHDLRRGSERLPGRKGKLARNDYIFLPISYKETFYVTKNELSDYTDRTLESYILSGGSPLALSEIYYHERLSDTFVNLINDWVEGAIIRSGRNRTFLRNLLRRIYAHSTSTTSYTKLAKEAGLANNTAALDYVERLSDLFCVLSCMQWDHTNDIYLARKPMKLHFINMAVAMTFHPNSPRYFHEISDAEGITKASIHEWLVAQELWRRSVLKIQKTGGRSTDSEMLSFWKSDKHEIDFRTYDGEFYEVKSGKTSPIEFTWFEKIFPKKVLTVISESRYETKSVRGITLTDFLMEAPSDLYYDEDKMPSMDR